VNCVRLRRGCFRARVGTEEPKYEGASAQGPLFVVRRPVVFRGKNRNRILTVTPVMPLSSQILCIGVAGPGSAAAHRARRRWSTARTSRDQVEGHGFPVHCGEGRVRHAVQGPGPVAHAQQQAGTRLRVEASPLVF